jgi:hypothetical protein
MQESWEDVRQTPERFIEVDAERTVAVVGFRGRGETYPSLDEALESAGVGSSAPEQRKES